MSLGGPGSRWRLAGSGKGVSDVVSVRPSGSLVGRVRELVAITSAMKAVGTGVQRVVHVVGEPGIGKTALAEHAAALARGQGWTVAWGRAWDPQGAPYWLWQQVLSAIVRSRTVVSRCHPGTLSWLIDLVPELGELAPPVPAASPEHARAALHRAAVHLLATAASDRPVMVILDDLHAADSASLTLANLVCRSLPNSPVLVITTQRLVPLQADAVALSLLREVNGQGLVVPVGALDRAAVTELASTRMERECGSDEAMWLWDASGGNPFLVDQLVRATSTEGSSAASEAPVVRAAMDHVVAGRLALLGTAARRVVSVAAVAGDEIDEGVLATVSALPPDSFGDAVDEAVRAAILWRREAVDPLCGWVHDLLREAAAAELPADLRRNLHQNLAVALEVLPARPDRLAQIAEHRRAALPLGDPRVMVDATVAAAASATAVFAHEAAIAQCAGGLSAIARYGNTTIEARRWRARLLCVLGRAEGDAGDPARARRTLIEAQSVAAEVGDGVLAAQAAVLIPQLATFLESDRELESKLATAVEALGDADEALRARLLARWSVVSKDDKDRRIRADQAVVVARNLGDGRVLADVLTGRLFVTWAPDTTRERLETADQIIDLATRMGDTRRLLDGRMWRLIALLEFGRAAEAEAELTRYEHLAELAANRNSCSSRGHGSPRSPPCTAGLTTPNGWPARRMTSR